MEVEVPDGCGPGDLLLIRVGESDVEVTVPEDCEAGDMFVIEVEMDGESEHEADPDIPVASVPAEEEERLVEAAEEDEMDEEEEFMIEIAASLAPSRRMKMGHAYRLQAAGDSDDDDGNEPELELEPEAEAQYSTILVAVPEGSEGGDVVTVALEDGREVDVTIPEGLEPGDEFECSVATEDLDEETMDADQPVMTEDGSDQGSEIRSKTEPAHTMGSEHDLGCELDTSPELEPEEAELEPESELEPAGTLETKKETAEVSSERSTESVVADADLEVAGEEHPDLALGVDDSDPGVLNEHNGKDVAHPELAHKSDDKAETDIDPVVPQIELKLLREPEPDPEPECEQADTTAKSSGLEDSTEMVLADCEQDLEPKPALGLESAVSTRQEEDLEPKPALGLESAVSTRQEEDLEPKPALGLESAVSTRQEEDLEPKPALGLESAASTRQEASRKLTDEEAAAVLREEQKRRMGWLQQVPIFKPVKSNSAFIEELAKRLEVRTIRKDEILIRKGDVTGTEMYFIARGAAEVLNSLGQKPFHKLSEGDFCGEGSLLEDAPRNAFVRIQTETVKLYALDRENLQQVLRSYPDADQVIRAPLEGRRIAREAAVGEQQQEEQEERKRNKREKQKQARQEKERKERYEAAKKAKAERDRETQAQAEAEEQAKAKAKAAFQRRLEQERKERVAAAALARREMQEAADAAAQSSEHVPEDDADGGHGWSDGSEEDHTFESIVGPQKILTVEEPQFQGWREYADEIKAKREEDEMAAAMQRSLLYQTPPKSTQTLVERGRAMHAEYGVIQLKKAEERAKMEKQANALANRQTKPISADGAEDLINRLYKPAKRSDGRLEDNSVRANINFVKSLRGPATPKKTGSAPKSTDSKDESSRMNKRTGGSHEKRDADVDEFADLEVLMSTYGGEDAGEQRGVNIVADSPKSEKANGGTGVFDRLGSPQNFTGVHKHRGRATGKAKGRGTGRGVVCYRGRGGGSAPSPRRRAGASIVSGGDETTPEPEPQPDPEPEQPAIFSRLADPEFFTGTHVHRFQSSAKKGRRRGGVQRQGAKIVAASPRQHVRGTQAHRIRGRGKAKDTSSSHGAAGDRNRDRGTAPRRQPLQHAQIAIPDEEVDLSGLSQSPGSADTSLAEQSMADRAAGIDDVSSHDSGSSAAAIVDSSTIFDKLTDHEQYTGAHRHRFDKKGNGRGLAGRDSIQKGAGHANRSAVVNSDGAVHDLSQIVRPSFYGGKQNVNGRSVSEGTPPRAKRSALLEPTTGIFAKLTDPQKFTGSHKARPPGLQSEFDTFGDGDVCLQDRSASHS